MDLGSAVLFGATWIIDQTIGESAHRRSWSKRKAAEELKLREAVFAEVDKLSNIISTNCNNIDEMFAAVECAASLKKEYCAVWDLVRVPNTENTCKCELFLSEKTGNRLQYLRDVAGRLVSRRSSLSIAHK